MQWSAAAPPIDNPDREPSFVSAVAQAAGATHVDQSGVSKAAARSAMPHLAGQTPTRASRGWKAWKPMRAPRTIGYLLVRGQASISTSIVMSGMIAIGIVGFAIDALLRALEARINRKRGR